MQKQIQILFLSTTHDFYKFWDDISILPADKIEILKKEKVSFAEKIALFDCNIWPKLLCSYYHERVTGHELYRSLQFEKAIVAYNMCLYRSTLEVRGIAYADRAAAYFAIRSYRDCLDSARLAKECPLPKNTKIKVLAQEKIAIEALEIEKVANGVNDTDLPITLSYRRNKRMPAFVFCLKLKDARNPYGGIVTTENLLPGDVLVLEPPLTTFTKFSPICDYCCGSFGSLQPCKCGLVLFCSSKCKENAFKEYHNIECPLMEHLYCFANHDCLVLRVFFKLIQRFKNVTSLREYLEKIKNPNPFDDNNFEAWSDPESFESQYRLYYATERPSLVNCTARKNNLFRTDIDNKNLTASMAKTSIVIEMLKTCKEIPRIARNTEEWSFLSELIFQLIFFKSFAIMIIPVCSETTYVQDNTGFELATNENIPLAVGALHGSASLFRSSCQANVEMSYVKNHLIVRARKHIPRGTELLVPHFTSMHNAFSLKASFPSMSFDLSRACFCAQCYEWFNWVSNTQFI